MNEAIGAQGTPDLRMEVESYLVRNGWVMGSRGEFGELWSRPESAGDLRIAVPKRVFPESREFMALVGRLSESEARLPLEVEDELEREFQDVQTYRIADAFVREESVLLDSAATVLQSARRLIRAAATTARKPRAYIGSSFSAPADQVANRARLSHTRRGSFVLPVVMPIDPPVTAANQILGFETDVTLETSERRATRTLASALAALDAIAVRSDSEPMRDGLVGLVESGVSRELVAAVRAIASDSGVHAFETRFQWAAGVGAPGGLQEKIVIPDDSVPLLRRLEAKLQKSKPRAEESISGPIVEIRHLPGDATGEMSVRTARGNRMAEVRVTASGDVIQQAADWFKSGRAVLAHGRVVSTPGRPLSMPEPLSVMPLDQLFLDAFRSG